VNIPLINPYPMQQAPHSPMRIQQQEYALNNGMHVNPLPELVSVFTPKEHVVCALHNFGSNILPTLIKDKLANLEAYKDVLNSMPNLSAVVGLKNYRQKHPKHDETKVLGELKKFGLFLTSGQAVFHGGVFPKDTNNIPLNSFVTDRPLSTSLCAQVASVHSLYHKPNNIWLIRIANNSKVKAFVYSNDSRQTHGHETEVLIEGGTPVKLQSTFQVKDFTIFEVELG
jgi:hypothetical protein